MAGCEREKPEKRQPKDEADAASDDTETEDGAIDMLARVSAHQLEGVDGPARAGGAAED